MVCDGEYTTEEGNVEVFTLGKEREIIPMGDGHDTEGMTRGMGAAPT